MDMIKSNRLSIDYYLSKMSMFLKDSYGITNQVEVFLDLMNKFNSLGNNFIDILDIFGYKNSEDYIFKIYNMINGTNEKMFINFVYNENQEYYIFEDGKYKFVGKINEEDYSSEKYFIRNTNSLAHDFGTSKESLLLDTIAGYYGVDRELIFTTYEESDEKIKKVTESIVLNNYELILVCQIKIINKYFDGSVKYLIDKYSEIGIKCIITSFDNNNNNNNNILSTKITLIQDDPYNPYITNKLDRLFKNDYIKINVLGVKLENDFILYNATLFILDNDDHDKLDKDVLDI